MNQYAPRHFMLLALAVMLLLFRIRFALTIGYDQVFWGVLSDIAFFLSLGAFFKSMGTNSKRIAKWLSFSSALGLAIVSIWSLSALRFLLATGTPLRADTMYSFIRYDGVRDAVFHTGNTSDLSVLIVLVVFPLLISLRVQPSSRAPSKPRSLLFGFVFLTASLLVPQLSDSHGILNTPPLSFIHAFLFDVPGRHDLAPFAEPNTKLPAGMKQLPPSPKRKPNIVYLFLESTRFRNVGRQNGASLTPQLDEIARRSQVFEHAYSVIPHTSKALYSTWCGDYPSLGYLMRESEVESKFKTQCLPKILRENGYQSAHFQSATAGFENGYLLAHRAGFETVIAGDDMDATGFELANYFGYEDRVLIKPVSEWVETTKEPFVLSVLTNTPHHDYRWISAYGSEHARSQATNYMRYQKAISYTDDVIGTLYKKIKATTSRDTIFVILGDHGEAFNEHKRLFHDTVPWNETLHIPMLIELPGRAARTEDRPVSQLDIFPTLLEELGIPFDAEQVAGHSVQRLPSKRFLFSACLGHGCGVSISEKGKYIAHFGNRPDEFFAISDELENMNIIDRVDISAHRRALASWYLQMTRPENR